jgi:hypothetical protein
MRAETWNISSEIWISNFLEDWVELIVDGVASRAYIARKNELLAS